MRAAALIPLVWLAGAAAASPVDGVRALDAELLRGDSATVVLQRRCAARHPGEAPTIRAIRLATVQKPPPPEATRILGGGLRYRRVHLACGNEILSEADNWYAPSRLTPEMNGALETTDTPFGIVVRPLGFHRRRLKDETLAGPAEVLRHAAVLVDRSGRPFAFVEETYTRAAVAAP
ncbi:MAG: hypothetical protein JOZ27_00025 [Caulobacteraceae bacterium]|nr:hypothetical protein [Caulobacteraceae bacterium]